MKLQMSRKRALELGLLTCKCGHPPNNHFDEQRADCARDGCKCKKYREIGVHGTKLETFMAQNNNKK